MRPFAKCAGPRQTASRFARVAAAWTPRDHHAPQVQVRGCWHQFSVTSGTIFASRKMAFVDLLAAICIFVNGAKGISALQLSRDLDCQYKTAFVLSHKLREAMAAEINGQKLDGHVEIDGAYFGGHIRPANLKEEGPSPGNTRPASVASSSPSASARPHVTFVHQQEADGEEMAKPHVAQGCLHADEAPIGICCMQAGRWPDQPQRSLQTTVITNRVESYFSRLRRMVQGQHHHVSRVTLSVREPCRMA